MLIWLMREGTFDAQNNQLSLHSEPQPGDEDLLDAAAIQTLLNSGTVYAIDAEQIPDKAPVAAIFCY
jgi:hypothetical protein